VDTSDVFFHIPATTHVRGLFDSSLFEVSFALINTYFSILFTALLLVLQLFALYSALVLGETQKILAQISSKTRKRK